MSIAKYLKSNERLNKLETLKQAGDDLYRRLQERKASFALSPERMNREGLVLDLHVEGARVRYWDEEARAYMPLPQAEGESYLSSWTPTISVSIVGSSSPFLRAKFRDTLSARQTWKRLQDAFSCDEIHSPGDLYRTIQESTYYPLGAVRTIVVGRVSWAHEESSVIAEVSKAADRVLSEIRNPLTEERIMEIMERVGADRLAFMLNRVGSLFRSGSLSRALYARERVKRLTGVDYAVWLATAEKASQASISEHEISDGADDLIVGQDDPTMPIMEDDE
jgi:hypothetical protein